METELKNDNTKHNRKNLLDLRILDHRVDQRNGVAQDHRNHDLCLDESNKTQISKKKTYSILTKARVGSQVGHVLVHKLRMNKHSLCQVLGRTA